MRNDSITVRFSAVSSNRSLWTVINVSTFSFIHSIPSSACSAFLPPSKENGLVTTPTVSAPCSRAILATSGAAPVPVPPPFPAVTNTMSAPLTVSIISSSFSLAARIPTSGSLPAPSPPVIEVPIGILTSALHPLNACASVFIPTNSTPLIPASIILFTALFPPPPTPMTLITAINLF